MYCRKCYSHRVPTKKNKHNVGFRPDSRNARKMLCAVDECDSEVTAKSAWVGIFM